MSQNGYQKFFKKAQDIKRADPAPMRFKVQAKPRTEAETERLLRHAVANTSPRNRKPMPIKAVFGLVFSVGIVAAYVAAPDAFEKLVDRIEIRATPSASAAETPAKPAEKAGTPATKAEKTAATSTKGSPAKSGEDKEAVSEDVSHFEKLKQRKEELDAREKELNELEEELQRQKVELDKRIVTLEEMRNQIAQILKDRVEVDQEKVNKLVDLYSNMKPKQAADVIGSLNEELAVEVLAKMKKKNAAEIMNLLPADKARVLSEKYTGYRRNHPAPDAKG